MQGKDRYELAKQMTTQTWGKARSDQIERALKELNPEFWEMAVWVFSLYADPVVDLKTRSLCQVAVLTALAREEELKAHIIGALNNGNTREQINAIIMQVAPYVGVPKAHAALSQAQKAFAECQPPVDKP